MRYDPCPDILDDHPDHVDTPQTATVPVVDPPTAPESLQSREEEVVARQRVKRTIKPPDRYGFSPAKTPKRRKSPRKRPRRPKSRLKRPSPSPQRTISRPRRPINKPQRYVDVTEAVQALMSIFIDT